VITLNLHRWSTNTTGADSTFVFILFVLYLAWPTKYILFQHLTHKALPVENQPLTLASQLLPVTAFVICAVMPEREYVSQIALY
jgi:hypothetical protein